MAFTVLRSGNEQQVNTLTYSNQVQPTIARLDDGGWVVTWTGQDVNESGIYMQRYNKDGEPQFKTPTGVVADRLVNTITEGSQIWSAVTALSDGGWVVSWIDKSTDARGVIHQQRYSALGVAQPVASTVVNPGHPTEELNNIEMTALANGEWLVTWQAADGGNLGIYQQRFNAAGAPQLDEARQLVNKIPTGYQRFSDVATLQGVNDGGWIVTWVDGDSFGPTADIYMRRYDRNGNPVTDDIAVTQARGMQTAPQVASLPNGGWLVVWYGVGADGSNDIFLKRYDAAGSPGETEVVNRTTDGPQKDPHVAVHDDGSWVITWQSENDVHHRRYDANGNTSGPDAVVPAWLGSRDNSNPQVITLSDGRWVVVWENLDQDDPEGNRGAGIAQRIFTPVTVQSVTDVAEYATGTGADETLEVEQNGLSLGDILDGGDGDDTLQMTWTGTIDLTLPTELLRFETLVGTGGNDRIVTDVARLGQFQTINGGAGSDDVLELSTGDNYSLRNKTITGIEKILLSDYVNYHVTVDSVATALLIDGSASSGDTVRLVDSRNFTVDELIQLFSQGVDVVIDGNGQHTNALPQIAGFNGDQSRALVGGMAQLDTGAVADVTEDLDRFRSLAVKITNRVVGEDRLGLIEAEANGVAIAGNQVFVNGTLAGTLEEDGSGSDGLLIAFTAGATEAMVTTLVRALAYVNTASGSFVAKQRNIAVTLTDAGGAQSTYDVQVDIALPTGGRENKAPVLDGTPTSVQNVADTGVLSPFADMVVADPDGDRLTVTVAFDKARGRLIPQAGGSYDADNGIFRVEGSALYVTLALKALQFAPRDRNGPVGQGEETAFTVRVIDGALNAEAQVKVNAVIADRPPSQPLLSNNMIDELVADGTPVGTLSAQDGNGEAITYSLVGAGDAPFVIVGNELRVKNGVALDYEQTKAYTFTIRASAGGLSNDRVVTIGVNDVGVEKTSGSAANDKIVGGAGKDSLGGGLGDDTLWGALGNDALTGNGGKDVFVFSTKTNKKTNVDKIADFSVKDDSIWLDNAVFTKIGKGSEASPAQLKKSFFKVGDKAKDKDDYVVYNKKTGVLSYDADGSGSKSAAVDIAQLKKGLSLSFKDVFVI